MSYFLRQKIINITLTTTSSKLIEEVNFLMPDDAEAITGVAVGTLFGVKSPLRYGDVYLSNEQISGSFFQKKIVGTENSNININEKCSVSGFGTENTIRVTPVYVPVRGGDSIRVTFISERSSAAKSYFYVTIRYSMRKLERSEK